MNKPKSATAPVDAERLVRELLKAFESLKTQAPLTCCSPEEGRSKGLELAGDALSRKLGAPTTQAEDATSGFDWDGFRYRDRAGTTLGVRKR